MPCSGRDYDNFSRISIPLIPFDTSTEIVNSASELDFVPRCMSDFAADAQDEDAILSRNTKTMATLSSPGSPLGHSSSIMSPSSATSTSSAPLGIQNILESSNHDAVLRPPRIFITGPGDDVNEMFDEGSSSSASGRMKVEWKGKTPERIQETNFPRSCTTNASRLSKSANSAMGDRKCPLLGNQTSVSRESEDPLTSHSDSSSTSCDSDDDGFGDLSASVATIRPPRPPEITERPESSASSVLDDASESISWNTSPHSDQGYTLEVRPPSSNMATRDGEEQDTYDNSPTVSQMNSPQPPPMSPLSPTTSSASRSNSRRQSIVRVASPPELPPVPPVASTRVRRSRVSIQDTPQISSGSTRPPSLSRRRSLEYPRADLTSSWYRAPRSSHNQAFERDTFNGQVVERSTSTSRSPSLSPLAWDTTSTAQGPTFATSAPVDYLTDPWPSEISDTPNPILPSPSNPLLSTPSSFWPATSPNVIQEENHMHAQSRRLSTDAGVMSSPRSPVTNLPNPRSVPQRTTRLTVPLPPSPGSSLRTSAFNSPLGRVASPVDSWGTPATIPGESVHNQPTSIPGEAAQWSDLPQPPLLAQQTQTWLPENGHNPLWPHVDWPSWSHPTQIPQVGPITATAPSPPYITPPGYLLICGLCGSPPTACVCRRYVRVAPVPTGATSAGSRTPPRPPPTPHPTFWFFDGTVTFEVEDVYFKVHKYFFERHSQHFRLLLARRLGTSANVMPVRIPDAKKLDFERLLKVFYPSNLANPDLATVEEWTSVLTLAVKWHMEELMSLAIQELTPITSAVDKISLAKKFGLFGYNLVPNSNYNRDWLLPALRELCGRNYPLRFEEARKLDMWTVVKVWEVQHEISNAGLSHNVSQVERLIKRRFGLE